LTDEVKLNVERPTSNVQHRTPIREAFCRKSAAITANKPLHGRVRIAKLPGNNPLAPRQRVRISRLNSPLFGHDSANLRHVSPSLRHGSPPASARRPFASSPRKFFEITPRPPTCGEFTRVKTSAARKFATFTTQSTLQRRSGRRARQRRPRHPRPNIHGPAIHGPAIHGPNIIQHEFPKNVSI
jgi:hypothetical protein